MITTIEQIKKSGVKHHYNFGLFVEELATSNFITAINAHLSVLPVTNF